MQDGRQAAQQYQEQVLPERMAEMEVTQRPQPPQRLNLKNSLASSRTNSNDETEPEARYECAICMSWLKEPVLTTCGHRFCKTCLNNWLRKKNQLCPMDNQKLEVDKDVFPDNYTRREIQQIKLKCEHNKTGCTFIGSPLEMEQHKLECPYRCEEEPSEEKCPFASIKCDFVGRPETNALEMHLKEDMPHHLQLMLRSLQNTAIASWNPQKPARGQNGSGAEGALPPPPQYANGDGVVSEEQLIQAMYQRIVVLEQRAFEQEVKIENLTKQLVETHQQVDARYSNGTIVWEIRNFQNLINYLRSNASHLKYSPECYTSPYGYKFCARLNIQPRNTNLLSLHVHLMQSENDIHLEWPFIGRIKLCMVHPRDMKLSQHDTIMTKPEILAFHQPRERISARGFGFVEYANIADIVKRGFCEDDRLLIKIQINLV
ncbi:TNF receptor-associated factor 6-like [Lucilia sericata]|uniref:TNF receptor-associated factor 6-like n=1 Tax=Lucilia sericata TaxID=13632 RepID=UPI0018A84DE8|nr:TNF receptor-associated factor 6-like [Lucilia sericata]XP_037822023.1 TNF receptor-associated factor 6-like [Lucilia sericata]